MTERTDPLLEWKVDLESEDLFEIVIRLKILVASYTTLYYANSFCGQLHGKCDFT